MEGLLDLLTGGLERQAQRDMEQAKQDVRNVNVPTENQLQYQIQKLVQAGILTPEQARTFLQSPNAMIGQNIDQTGTDAQQEAIASLLNDAASGGVSPVMEAGTQDMLHKLATAKRGANEAIEQRQAERGTLTSGMDMAAKLAANQSADADANAFAVGNAANAYNARLGELTSAGGMGANLQGQANTQGNTVAAATNAINQFNAAQQQQEENFNTTSKNEAGKYNLENLQGIENQNTTNANEHAKYNAQIPQQIFADEMQKAAANVGVSENSSNLAMQQGGQEAGLIGGLVSTLGNMFGSSSGKGVKTGSDGGVIDMETGGPVPGQPEVAGDDPRNDTVPALLSPGEVVLPRSVSQNPQPDKVMDFLKRMRPVKTVHPDDAATLLHALGRLREVA